MINVAEPSYKSLLLKILFGDTELAKGTGFLVSSREGSPLLITNRHIVTGKHQKTGQALDQNGSLPDRLIVKHNKLNKLGEWVETIEPLYNEDGEPRWIEHPTLGKNADFVALPLSQLDDVDIHPYDPYATNPPIIVDMADAVSVVGFPFGVTVGESLAVWATGFVASDRTVDYDNLPIFLIDCRTRQGQSGSAVIAYRSSGKITLPDGRDKIYVSPVYRFLGIYSGRINKDSDIGIVWKTKAIQELLDSIKF